MSNEKSNPKKNGSLFIGETAFLLILTLGVIGPLVYPHQPSSMLDGMRLSPPSWTHPFGTDPFGRDMLSRVMHGIRIAFLMGFSATLIAGVCGTILGISAGFLKGWVDRIFSRFIDLWLSLPSLLLALIFIAKLGPSLITTTFVLGFLGIPSFYRTIRADTLRVSQEEYILSAFALGAPTMRIMFLHILPNMAHTIITLCTLRVGTIILAGSGLSFIGLGAQPPTPELGALLAVGRDYYYPYWWLVLFPGAAIISIIFSIQLIGDGLRFRSRI